MKFVGFFVCLGCVIGSGYYHGVITDRWGDSGDIADAVQRFERVPLTVGNWNGEILDNRVGKDSGLSASVSVRYPHKETGKNVTISLGCGRPRHVAIHTPDVCYAANGFFIEGQTMETI